MKKIILYVMLTALTLVTLLPTAVFADMSAVLSLISDAAEPASPGDEFTVTLHIKGDYRIHGANLSVDYDPASLEVKSAEQCQFLKDSDGTAILDYTTLAQKGQIKLGLIFPSKEMSGEGDLIQVTFKIKDGVTEHQQVILTVYEFIYMPIGENASSIYCTTENAVIHIKDGSDPSYGYNPGESGTPEPNRPDRPHPAVSNPTEKPTETVTAPPTESVSPENSGEPVPSALNSPVPTEQDAKDKKDNTKAIIIYTVLGAVAAAAVIVLIVTGVKKRHK